MKMDFSKAAGNKLIKEAQKKTDESLNSERIIQIDLNDLVPNPDNEKVFNMKYIKELAATIQDEGFTGAIEVIPIDDGKYEISSGHRRYEAMKMLKRKTIPCVVLNNVNEKEKARHLILSNINNRELTPIDKARAIEYYIEKVIQPTKHDTAYLDECVRVFHMGNSQIRRVRNLLKLPESIQDLIASGAVSYGAFDSATKLSEKGKLELARRLELDLSAGTETIGSLRVKQIIDGIYGQEQRDNKEKEQESSKDEVRPDNKTDDSGRVLITNDSDEDPFSSTMNAFETIPVDQITDIPDESFSYTEIKVFADDEIRKSIEFIRDALHKDVRNKEESLVMIKELKDAVKELEKSIK